MSEQLNKAIALVKEFNETHGVKMQGGKKYTMVKERIEAFRIVFGTDLGITTKVLHMDDVRVAVQCDITNVDGFVIASGIAEEERNASRITKTSALEVAQTSAAGRALAMLGLAGGEFASGDEIFNAQNTEKAQAKGAFKPAAKAAPKPAVSVHPIETPVQPVPFKTGAEWKEWLSRDLTEEEFRLREDEWIDFMNRAEDHWSAEKCQQMHDLWKDKMRKVCKIEEVEHML